MFARVGAAGRDGRGWGLWAAMMAGLLILGACSDSSAPAKSAGGKRAVPVTVAQAASRDIPLELPAVGQVEALVNIAVKSRVMGQVVKVHFKEGDMVTQGQPLFTIDQRPYEVALKEAEAKLARDQALAHKAESDLKRYDVLRGQKTVSASQYEQYFTEVQVRRATVAADQADVDNARLQLNYCSIKAPVSGVTGSLLLDEGNLVKANDEKPMVTILQVQPIYVNFAVPEKYLGQIMELRRTRTLEVQAVVPGQEKHPLRGELTFLDNAVDPASGTVRMKATFPNQDLKLWPGQFARATLYLTILKDQVVVPSQAVLTGRKGHYLYLVGAGDKAETREVTPGMTFDGHTVIDKGLKPGEPVVLDGQSRLVPGTPLAVKPVKPAAKEG